VEQPAAHANDRRTADPPRLRKTLLWQTVIGITRAAAALVDSAPWDKTAAVAALAVVGPVALERQPSARRGRWDVDRWG